MKQLVTDFFRGFPTQVDHMCLLALVAVLLYETSAVSAGSAIVATLTVMCVSILRFSNQRTQ